MNLTYLRNVNNYDSEIRLIIQGYGNQKLLNDKFDIEPSEVFVNGIQNNSCTKTCYLTEDQNNITLKFTDSLN